MDKQTNKVVNYLVQISSLILLLGFAYIFYRRQVSITGFVATLSVKELPYYAVRSLIRMVAAYILSLVFSIVYGLLAATSKRREAVMLPILDILQSVPILGFFPAAVYFFISIAPSKVLGAEFAAIFLIFTSQAWNIAFSVYESVSMIPKDLYEAYSIFDPEGNLKLKRLYIPSMIPKLVYNSILSWTNGWFFLVASEIFAIGTEAFRLPGIGSFIMESASENKIPLMLLGIMVLAIVIILLDLFIWKPVSQWSRRFTYSVSPGEEETKEVWDVVIVFWEFVGKILNFLLGFVRKINIGKGVNFKFIKKLWTKKVDYVVRRILLVVTIGALVYAFYAIAKDVPRLFAKLKFSDLTLSVEGLGLSFLRIAFAYVVAFGWTFPTAIYLYRHPFAARFISPIIQILPSIPAIAFFPLVLYFLLPIKGGLNITAIIIILAGMQWYLLFTIYGGLKAIPDDLAEVTDSFGVRGKLKLKRLLWPAALPSIMTGTITAMGGAWNALVVAEYATLNGKAYSVLGIGSLLNISLASNDQSLFIISLAVMVVTVYSINHFAYRPLYDKIIERYKIEG
ncbi:MAG: ABC transporter permease subunit [Caldisericaceae bacterium]